MVRFFGTVPGRLLVLLSAGFVLLVGAAAYRVHVCCTPSQKAGQAIDFASMELQVEDVRFPSADGIALRGWLIRGQSGMPAIILCHEFGSDKASLISLAIALRERGFTLLLIDFRGHGDNARGGSTLGMLEKRDILGAFDLLSRMALVGRGKVGLYGVGMGAHAAVLAAADQPAFRVLVLDSLYPDVSYALLRRFYGGWEFGIRRLGFLPRTLWRLMRGGQGRGMSAAATIGKLLGRDILMLAPQDDADLTAQMKRMYLTIPDQTDVDGNLLIVPATRAGTLYGDQIDSYHDKVADFFLSRLAAD